LFKNTKIRLAMLGAALLLPLAGACGGGDADVATAPPASPTSVVPTTVAPTTTIKLVTTTSTTVSTTTTTTVSTTTTTSEAGPVEIVVSVEAGSVEGGGRIPVELDAEVRLVVTADVADEVHIHGYDIFADVTPGTPATLEFVADIPGIFEVEMESSGLVLLELVVEP